MHSPPNFVSRQTTRPVRGAYTCMQHSEEALSLFRLSLVSGDIKRYGTEPKSAGHEYGGGGSQLSLPLHYVSVGIQSIGFP
jgi:hypothetical protein